MKFRNRLLVALLAALPFGVALAAAPDAVLVPTGGGDKFQLSFDDKHVTVESGATQILAQSKAGMRYYRDAKGEALAEVKYELNGLKLRDASEKLLWKVKFDGDKIKIGNDEELKNPYVIKVKPEQDKVYNAKNVELGAVKQNGEGKIKVKDAKDKELYAVETGRMSAAYGVLLLKDIPAAQRTIIAAEIFLQNR